MRAVQFAEFGDVGVLHVVDLPAPHAGDGEVVVEVRAAGLNPGEIAIRHGDLEERWPTTLPCGQGTDFAGVVTEVGAGVTATAIGDEVVGWTEERASQAELVRVPASQVVPKPPSVPWTVAGGLYVAGGAAWAGVTAVGAAEGETVVVSGAAGGVGALTVQLLHARGARAIALASPTNQEFLEQLHAVHVDYSPAEGLDDRIRAAAGEHGVSAWIDVHGGGYVRLAADMGVAPERINTIIDFTGAEEVGANHLGTHDVTDAAVLTELVAMVADGRLQVPVSSTYPLEQVREAQSELAEGHTRGKIVLLP